MEQKIQKEFLIKFNIVRNEIQTQIKVKNVSPQEAIGLLEMAKNQLLEKMKTRNVFEMSKGDK